MGGVLSSLAYSAKSVMRNKIRSLYSAVGVVLAVSLVTGSLVAIDSSVYGLLRSALEPIPVDFVGTDIGILTEMDDSVYSPSKSALGSLPDIEEVAAFASISGWTVSNESCEDVSSYGTTSSSLVFLENDCTRFLESYGIAGTLPAERTVAISNQIAEDLGLKVGDRVVCSRTRTVDEQLENGSAGQSLAYLNFSLEVSQIWTQNMPPDYAGYRWTYAAPDVDDVVLSIGTHTICQPVVLNMADAPLLVASMISFDSDSAYEILLSYLVWIDRGSVINPADIEGSYGQLDQIKNQLDRQGSALGIEFQDTPLTEPLDLVRWHLEDKKPVLLGISLPVIVLGMYLSFIGADLGIRHRRQEVGILKSRGGSNRQAFTLLVSESCIVGVLGGILGLLVGACLSRILLDVAVSYSRQSGAPLVGDLVMQPSTILAAIVLGILLMVISTYIPFRRATSMDVAESIRNYSPRTAAIEYRARYDVVALFFALLSAVSVFFFPEAPNYRLSFVIEAGLTFPIWIGHAIVPAVPFLLSFSLVRLLTRLSTKPFIKFASLMKGWTKSLHHIVQRNIERNPRRASDICVMIALALSFGLFVSVTMESSIAYEKKLVEFRLGAEVSMQGNPPLASGPVDVSVLEEIDTIEGVEHHCVSYSPLVLQETRGYTYVSSAVLNASAYAETVKLHDSFFVDADSGDLLKLTENGSVLVTELWAKSQGFDVGDVAQLRFMYNLNSLSEEIAFSVRIAGYVRGLPGFEHTNLFIGRSSLEFLSDDFLLRTCTTMVLIDVDDGHDESTVANKAYDRLESAGLEGISYQVLSQELAKLERDPSFGALRDFLEMEYALALIIISVGVGLVMFAAVAEREQELACIIARGSSKSQMRRILVGESVSVMAFGAVVGLSVGILTSIMYNHLMTEGVDGVIDRSFVFDWTAWTVILASIGSLLSASLLASMRAGRIRLNEVLRMRSG
jgi:ABC-type lipoprotein release transport system permease subunit